MEHNENIEALIDFIEWASINPTESRKEIIKELAELLHDRVKEASNENA